MRLVKKQGYNLFDIETFICENKLKAKTPEIILWNEKELILIEAKQSAPRDVDDSVLAELGKQAEKHGYKLVSKLELYCDALWEKFTTALVFLRPDVINHFLDKAKDDNKCVIENKQCLRRIKLNQAKDICLLFILKGIPTEEIPPLRDKLNMKIAAKMKEWQPNCRIAVMNEELATAYGVVEPLSCGDIQNTEADL